MRQIKVSVRNLINFVLRSGDIDNSFMSMGRALEGTRAHQKVQKSYGKNYQAEYSLKHSFQYEDLILELEGRTDGILEQDKMIIIDEIKSTTKKLEDLEEDYNQLHWAQAKCYAYIYSLQKELSSIGVQLTYFQLESEEVKIFQRNFTFPELEGFFIDLIDKYIEWAKITLAWTETMDRSIKDLNFPFDRYRKGQRELAVAVYQTIVQGKKIFAQAPTGIGKTMSTLFPAIKAIGEEKISKIFYLTAKTITREAALNSVRLMVDQGLRIKTLVITAKDKICLNDEVKCNPRDCIYAKGHFDRVNGAIMDIFQNEDIITRDKILEYAEKHQVCPFEFSLDISIWADVIICDYNYAFDPQVYLKRFFEGAGQDYAFLIDEAHNLVDRSRDMFSASINKADFLDLRDIFKDKYPKIYKGLNKVNNIINRITKELGLLDNYYQKEELKELYFPIRNLITGLEPWLIEEKDHENYEGVLDFYFNLSSFIRIWEFYDEHYVTSLEKDGRDLLMTLYCVDASYLLQMAEERARASIFFSATLTPLDYYMDLLGGKKDDYHIRLASPFPKERLGLFLRQDISTRYRDREKTYGELVETIKTLINSKKGNYLVFFPSYIYMIRVYEILKEEDPDLNIIIQEGDMTEGEREDFLEGFREGEELLGLAVMGGIFSEGIDLVGDRLIGTIIVGVGLPQICFERDLIKDYFDHHINQGFDYAYVYPGMNKVLQAAGRVIRTEKDKGVIILIDDRFATRRYQNLFPREWKHHKGLRSSQALERELKIFWRENDEEGK